MPGKWVKRFQETHQQDRLVARPLSQGEDPLEELEAGRSSLVLLRHPEGASPAGPRLHVIPLYTERPVVVAPKDHDVEYFDAEEEIPAEAARDWPRLDPADFPPETGGTAMLAEVVAAGDAAVTVLPQSLARLHARKDTVWRFIEGERPTVVGLAWPRVDPTLPDEEQPRAVAARDNPLVEELIGVIRGRRAGSSRQPSVREREQAQKQQRRGHQRQERKNGQDTGHRAAGPRGGSTGARGRRRGRPRR